MVDYLVNVFSLKPLYSIKNQSSHRNGIIYLPIVIYMVKTLTLMSGYFWQIKAFNKRRFLIHDMLTLSFVLFIVAGGNQMQAITRV